MKQGAADYLVKPVGANELLHKMQEVLSAGDDRPLPASIPKLSQRLCQSHRLETVGRLTNELAHDLNDLMTVIVGYGQLMLIQTGSAESLRPQLIELEKAAGQAGKLTQQLISFGRQHMMEPRFRILTAL